MYRKIAAVAAILIAGLAVGGPAFALFGPGFNDRPHLTTASEPGRGPAGPGATTSTTVKRAERPKPPAATDGAAPAGTNEPAATTSTTAARSETPKPPAPGTNEDHRDLEQLRLACTGARSGDAGGAKCEWSPSHAPTFARYVLWRQDPGKTERRAVFTTADIAVTRFYDVPLAPGTYTYGVLALDGANKGVGSGGPATATVPAAPAPAPTTTAPPPTAPKPGTMSFACTTAAHSVTCTWGKSTSERFGSYRLYREVTGTPAQPRFTTTDRNVTSATDSDVTPGMTYTYRIVTLDTNGQPLAYGGPVTVKIPTGGTGDAPNP